jgi:hypothetical protein
MLREEEPTFSFCRRCQSPLVASPEWEPGDWFIRCLACGARNVLAITLEIVGWRRENSSAFFSPHGSTVPQPRSAKNPV